MHSPQFPVGSLYAPQPILNPLPCLFTPTTLQHLLVALVCSPHNINYIRSNLLLAIRLRSCGIRYYKIFLHISSAGVSEEESDLELLYECVNSLKVQGIPLYDFTMTWNLVSLHLAKHLGVNLLLLELLSLDLALQSIPHINKIDVFGVELDP